jgi:hypothetical protein
MLRDARMADLVKLQCAKASLMNGRSGPFAWSLNFEGNDV